MPKEMPKVPASYKRFAEMADIDLQSISNTYVMAMRELSFAHGLLKRSIPEQIHNAIHQRVLISNQATYQEGPVSDMEAFESKVEGDCIGKMAEYLARKNGLTDDDYKKLKTEAGL